MSVGYKPKGEGIIKIRVHEARSEHKIDFGNVITHGLYST
jgi:hypothetical protein